MNQQSVPGAPERDELAIRELMTRLSESWARGDARAYGAEFTADCDYVAFDGTRFRGPTEPGSHLARLFDTVLKDSRLEGEVESVRFVTPDAAVVHWTGSVAYPWQQRVKRRRLSRQTLVVVRRVGRWQATAFQNTRVRPLSQEGVGFELATRLIRWRAARARRARAGRPTVERGGAYRLASTNSTRSSTDAMGNTTRS
ncbi:MAG: SgcJ/EcaC family oxidoreductase [Streptomycetales bacterium]